MGVDRARQAVGERGRQVKYHFRLTGEFFTPQGETSVIIAGTYAALHTAMRSARSKGQGAPDDVVQLLSVAEPSSLEVVLFRVSKDGTESQVMAFDVATGRPVVAEPDEVWPLVRRSLEELR